ncbi:polysaccharide lyase family 8 super-sandwich domain-containing protein [Rapidithrix thailandica]|uniref:Polysaccharide lyase family 8 super-sandwich domain-containing protein n=1 Tax=Rapidithrix thailandica TaxID=413964 RepID=A0AAW9S6Z0_9BACT
MTHTLCLITGLYFGLCSWVFAQSPTDYETIMGRVRNEFWKGNANDLDNTVGTYLASVQSDGSWTDIDYASTSRTNWSPHTHLTRVRDFAKAYTWQNSTYYTDTSLYQAIVNALSYWDVTDPQSNNWWYNQIASPQRLGEILILLRAGATALPSTLENNLITQMNRGNPGSWTGANKLDIAIHWIYRGCLLSDQSITQTGVDESFYPLQFTTGEGLQHDYSYQQHGAQLHISSYGLVFINGEVKVAGYVQGTSFALSGSKLSYLSNYIRQTYLSVLRSHFVDYNVTGRAVSRKNNLNKQGFTSTLQKMKTIDAAYSAVYDDAIARISGTQSPDYAVNPKHTHYWRSDYVLHNRPAYTFSTRTVSNRTVRSENGNGENLKGYFLTDGATNISVNGNEYFNIFPVWEWNKVPGVTAPELATIPVRSAWQVPGTSTFTGGVSDSLYGVTAFAMNDYGVNVKKSWFFFDEEIVCLGADLNATASENITTTVNQCVLDGSVTVSQNGSVSTVGNGAHAYNGTADWILHDSVGYFFPQGGNLQLTNQTQSGSWYAINTTHSNQTVATDVFKLWFDHGVQPSGSSYAYIVAPGKRSATEMQHYDLNNIEILANSGGVQAVKHKGLNLLQVVFYQATTFTTDSMTVWVDQPCVLMFKNIGSNQVTTHIADPAQNKSAINVYVELPGIDSTRQLTCTLPTGAYAGSTVAYVVNENTPVFQPEGVLPVADAYVRNGSSANTNYGSSSLVVKNDGTGYARESYLKFDLSEINGPIAQAKLKLVLVGANTDITSTTWEVAAVSDDSWTETGITWNNKPAKGSVLASQPGQGSGEVEWDITNQFITELTGDQVLSLHLSSTAIGAKTDATFYSKEANVFTVKPILLISDQVVEERKASADAYVRGGTYAADNYGTSTTLVVKNSTGSSYSRESYLKFDLNNLPANVNSAKLKLYVNYGNTDVTSTTWEVHAVSDDTWLEEGITWNTKPATSGLLATQPGQGPGYVEWDITNQVNTEKDGDGTLSVKLISTGTGSKTDAIFASRETSDAAKRPTLIVESSSGTTYSALAGKSPVVHLIKENGSASVYPNPVHMWLTVQAEGVVKKIEIRNANGQLMRVKDRFDARKADLDVSALPQGLYILLIHQEEGVSSHKFLKTN